MCEQASYAKTKTLESILVLQPIFWAYLTSELRKRKPMVHMQR